MGALGLKSTVISFFEVFPSGPSWRIRQGHSSSRGSRQPSRPLERLHPECPDMHLLRRFACTHRDIRSCHKAEAQRGIHGFLSYRESGTTLSNERPQTFLPATMKQPLIRLRQTPIRMTIPSISVRPPRKATTSWRGIMGVEASAEDLDSEVVLPLGKLMRHVHEMRTMASPLERDAMPPRATARASDRTLAPKERTRLSRQGSRTSCNRQRLQARFPPKRNSAATPHCPPKHAKTAPPSKAQRMQ